MLAISKTLDQSSFTSRWRTFSDFPDFSESGKPLRKIRKPSKKLESRFRKRKAGEEIGKPLKKIFLDFSKMRRISQKRESR
jgi:hypothetical protein